MFEKRYVASFVGVMILIPFATTLVYYFVVLGGWSQNPEMNFQNIKEVLVRYGNLSEEESLRFSNSSITGSNFYHVEEAIELARQDLDGWGLFFRVAVPVLVVIIVFIVFALRVDIPGISKDFAYRGVLPDKTLDYVSDLTRAIITVDGFIISILGASLVSSGLNNFYFFLGFETIIISLISCLASYPSFIRAGTLKEQEKGKDKEENSFFRIKLATYFRFINFSSWSLILGLIFLATSFS